VTIPQVVKESVSTEQLQVAVTFADLYQAHAALIWRTLRRLGVRPADLDDQVQEVFIVAHRKFDAFHAGEGSSARAWLCAIALRVAADARKKAYVRKEVLGTSDAGAAVAVDPSTPLQALEAAQARQFLDQCLDQLSDDRRAVFTLYQLEEMPMLEIAAALDCPVQTAYSRLHSAREDLTLAMRRLQGSGSAARKEPVP
jgi:RNA polymerase sigma-70 factor, ECF subfamily